jgi:hypothetical protein
VDEGSRDQPGTADQTRSVAAEINMSKTFADTVTWMFGIPVEHEFNLEAVALSR